MTNIKCKFCKSDTHKILVNGLLCKQCHSMQVIEMASDEVINNFYIPFNEKYHGGGPEFNQIKYAV